MKKLSAPGVKQPSKKPPAKYKTEGHEYDNARPKKPVVSRYGK